MILSKCIKKSGLVVCISVLAGMTLGMSVQAEAPLPTPVNPRAPDSTLKLENLNKQKLELERLGKELETARKKLRESGAEFDKFKAEKDGLPKDTSNPTGSNKEAEMTKLERELLPLIMETLELLSKQADLMMEPLAEGLKETTESLGRDIAKEKEKMDTSLKTKK